MFQVLFCSRSFISVVLTAEMGFFLFVCPHNRTCSAAAGYSVITGRQLPHELCCVFIQFVSSVCTLIEVKTEKRFSCWVLARNYRAYTSCWDQEELCCDVFFFIPCGSAFDVHCCASWWQVINNFMWHYAFYTRLSIDTSGSYYLHQHAYCSCLWMKFSE